MGKKSIVATSGLAGVQYRFKQGIEFTGALERGEIIIATNMVVGDKNLWDGIASRELFHLPPHVHIVIDGYFIDGNPFGFQQPLSADAIGTEAGAIHGYFRHTYLT
jgi:hypothetical protein